MKVLFTTPILEYPAAGGPQLRIETSILALNRVCELHVVARIEKADIGGDNAERYYRSHCREMVYTPAWDALSENRAVRKVQRVFKVFFGQDDASFLLEYADRHRIDVIWFGYGNISFPLIKKIKAARPDLKVVCDTDSVWSRFILRGLPYEDDPKRKKQIEDSGRLKEEEEREWVNLCEVTTAVSEVDAEYYLQHAADRERIKLFSNVINLDTYAAKVPPPPGLKHPCMYFAGSFGPDAPTDKAVRWVISEVLPLVRQKIPDIHFYVVGRDSDTTLKDITDPGITVTGKLPSVLPYLCNADVSVVPLTFESGTRFKILEAAACLVPTVSTTLGAEGIPVVDGEHMIIADDPQSFADGICRLIEDKSFAARIAENCRELVQQNYGVSVLAREAESILNFLRSR